MPFARRLFSLPSLALLALAVGLLAFLVKRLDIDVGGVWAQVRGSDLRLYFPALVCYYASFIVRGFRWRLIGAWAGAHKEPGSRLPSTAQCALMTLVGWFGNAVGWLRMGDAYRAYAFSLASRGSFSRSLGILVAERITDAVAIFVLSLLATIALAAGRKTLPSPIFLLVALAMVLAAVVGMLLLALLGPRLQARLPLRLHAMYERFHAGALGSLPQLPVTALLGALGWLLEAGRLFLVLHALGVSVASPLVLFVALANGLLTSIPLTPGGLGVVEPGIVGLLGLALPRESAVSAALLDRSISYLSVIPAGALAFVLQRFWLRGKAVQPS